MNYDNPTDTYFLMHFLGTPPKTSNDLIENQLHVTVLAHLALTRNNAEAIQKIDREIEGRTSFRLTAGELKHYGPSEDIAVLTLKDPEKAASILHSRLYSLFPASSYAQPQYAGMNYSPHITLGELTTFDTDEIIVDTLTLVKHIGGMGGRVELVKTYTLS